MNPIEAIITCFRKYAVFSGRATRPEFWWFTLFMIGLLILFALVDGVFGLITMVGAYELYPLTEVFGLVTTLPFLAVTARRLHDIGSASRSFIIVMAVVVGALYLFTAYEMITDHYVSESLAYTIIASVSLAVLITILWMARKPSQSEDKALASGSNESVPS
ncbi:MAG: DUF805 domain-containing protein [Pseudomonadota bacterium]